MFIDNECDVVDSKIQKRHDDDFEEEENEYDREFINDENLDLSTDEEVNFYRVIHNQVVNGINNINVNNNEDDEDLENEGEFDLYNDFELNNSLRHYDGIDSHEEGSKISESIDKSIVETISCQYEKFIFSCQSYNGSAVGECLYYSLLHSIVYERKGVTLHTCTEIEDEFKKINNELYEELCNNYKKKMKFIHINEI